MQSSSLLFPVALISAERRGDLSEDVYRLKPANSPDISGELVVTRKDGQAWFDVGAFRSLVATMPQPDGSLAFMTIDPVALGFSFVRADKDGVRKLIVRDGQHEYVFDEVK